MCERFGFELKGTGFLGHWESQSSLSLAALLRQSLKLRQPICLSSIAATAENGMVELETILTPMTFNGSEPTRFFGMVQMLSDPTPLLGRTITYERLIGSQLIKEDEPLPHYDQTNLPPPPPSDHVGPHSKAPYLRLVVNQDHPASFGFWYRRSVAEDVRFCGRLRAANNDEQPRV